MYAPSHECTLLFLYLLLTPSPSHQDTAQLSHRRPLIEISTEWLPEPKYALPHLSIDMPELTRVAVVYERKMRRTTVSVDTRLLFFAVLMCSISTAAGLSIGSPTAPKAALGGVRPAVSSSINLATPLSAPASVTVQHPFTRVDRPELEAEFASFFDFDLDPLSLPTYPAPASSVVKLHKAVRYLDFEQRELVNEALDFAAKAHQEQRRKSGEPFIIHPIEVACILAELRMDWSTIAAALLHDVVEDTEVTIDELEASFGEHVATIVSGVTDADGAGDQTNQRSLLLAMSAEWRCALVKLADRLHNMRTLQHMPKPKQVKKARETLSIFVPLAASLGVVPMEAELRRLSATHMHENLDADTASEIVDALPGSGAVLEQLSRLQVSDTALDELLTPEERALLVGHRAKWVSHCEEAQVCMRGEDDDEEDGGNLSRAAIASVLAAPVAMAAPAVAHAAAAVGIL